MSGSVIMKTKLLFLFLCIHTVLSLKHLNNLNHDPYRQILERTYVTDHDKIVIKEDCGKPLILSPYIEKNRTREARKAAFVESKHFLPGIESYAGYLTVDEKYNSNLFFWYFPVMNKSIEETPLILWLQGGPGCSSLFGLFEEIGPYTITKDMKIKAKEHSWSVNHSLLFIDNPVGTGFSFTDSDDGYSTNQTAIGENLYKALQQFFQIFPEVRPAPLIIAGESYAGKHIPSLGIQIHWHKDRDQPINLQGLAIGNGFIDPVTLTRTSYVAREMGIVDDRRADYCKTVEDFVVKKMNENRPIEAFHYLMRSLDIIEMSSSIPNIYNILSNEVELFGSYVKFVQKPEIRRALHVGNTSYDNVGEVYEKLVPDFMNSAKMWLEELLDHYRVMVYSGHLDLMVAYRSSVNTYKSLEWKDASEYKNAIRVPWLVDENIAGYVKEAGKLWEVMVRGAGHMVPIDQPAAALQLISAFAKDLPLSSVPDDDEAPPNSTL